MKTWQMIKRSVKGDTWHSETLGYRITQNSRGFISLKSRSKFHSIKASNNFLRATDWKKINKNL